MTDHPPVSHIPAPDTFELEKLLASFKASPGDSFYNLFEQASWNTEADHRRKANHLALPRSGKPYALTFAFLGLLIVVGLFFLTPAGKTLAETITRYFMVATNDRVTETVSLTPMPTPDPGFPYNQYGLSIPQVKNLTNFEVKIPDYLPETLQFQGARYDADLHKVSLLYVNGNKPNPAQALVYLYIDELIGDFLNFDWGTCPTGTIQKTFVRGWPAEIAKGAVWTTTTQATPGVQREWVCETVNDELTMALRWQEQQVKYEIDLTQQLPQNDPQLITQEELLRIAESLK